MSDRFPHRFTPESGLRRWERLRVEDLPFRDAVLNTFSYFRKAVYKKRSAPAEAVRHFDAQRQLLRRLRDQPAPDRTARLALVGDIMWIRDGWDDFLDPNLLAHLNAHDAVLGNLESVISPRFKVPKFFPDYLTFNSHPNLVRAFRRPDGRSTFTALSTANNHALDRGEPGARDTLALLDELGIPHSGVRFDPAARPYAVFEAGGLRWGFYAAAWGLNSFVSANPNVHLNALPAGVFAPGTKIDLPDLRRALAGMTADGCDLRVVALHWGYEFEYYPDPGVMRVGHEVVRLGADVVLGTHPHVPQPCEVLCLNGYEQRLPEPARPLAADATLDADGPPRKALIAYSLGNFATTMFTFACRVGWVLGLRVFRDPATGRADWAPGDSAFVVNVPRFGRPRRRRLMLLDDYRRLSRDHGGVPAKQEAYLAFLDRHLHG
ncbi:MAG: hypothetical protein C0501_07330 [Isosphaera sp.]|nr:hypothetical protein [Isosphaera sp.]